MTDLPIKQISKSQRVWTQVNVEPDTKVVQADFGRQASLKARQIRWSFAGQAEGAEQFVLDRFDDLSQTGQPATPGFGPLLRDSR
jgi:hypothetical protein